MRRDPDGRTLRVRCSALPGEPKLKFESRTQGAIPAPGTIIIPTSKQISRSRGEACPSIKYVRAIFDLGLASNQDS
jgi:hypothetical protein